MPSTPAPHPGLKRAQKGQNYLLMNPAYSPEELNIKPHHRKVQGLLDSMANNAVLISRTAFDKATGYGPNMTEEKWLQRMIFLETVAGIPGMVAGMLRHMKSLRMLKRDNGWIHTLLEEAENERMHLLTFLQLKDPNILFRGAVVRNTPSPRPQNLHSPPSTLSSKF